MARTRTDPARTATGGAVIDVTDGALVARQRRLMSRRRVIGRVTLYLSAVVAAVLAAAPFIWGTVTMFKRDADLYNANNNPFVFNLDPTLKHVKFVFTDTAFLTFAWNTLWVGLIVVAITLLVGLPAAYSLARLPFRWGGPLGVAIFLVYLIPPTLLFISLSRVVAVLGLQDSIWSLVLIYPTITIPVSIWLLMGFLKAIPRDLEEQAMVDGYSRAGAFLRAVVPLALPGIIAVIVFAFVMTANEFIYALAFVSPTAQKTISVGVPTELIRGDVFFWQSLQAAAVITAVPIAFAFNLLLERFIAGFTMGAVKT